MSAAEELVIGRHFDEDDLDSYPPPDTTAVKVLGGQKCYVQYSMAEGYYVFAILPQSEGLLARNTALFVNSFAEILIFALLFSFLYMLIRNSVVRKMREVTGAVAYCPGGSGCEGRRTFQC